MKITGIVTAGLGEGVVYVEKYNTLFFEKLGFSCFPGTLNLKVVTMPTLPFDKKITIVPGDKGLFPVDCYKVRIGKEGIEGAVVLPHKTRHKNIVEIISAQNLRKALNLHDRDEVVCESV